MTLTALKQFPAHLIGTINGLLVVLLTQPEGILFVILGVLSGFALHSAWAGAAIAFGLYTLLYVVTQYVVLFASKMDQAARVRSRDNG